MMAEVMASSSPLQRITAVVAGIACLVFLTTLKDTNLPRLVERKSAPTLEQGVVRDAVLTVTVVSQKQPSVTDPGKATEPRGPAIEKASVRVYWQDEDRYYDVGEARTDAQGRCRIEHLPRGVLLVLAEAAGRARSSTRLVVSEKERRITFGLLPAKSLTVTVNDEEQRALKGATVLVNTRDLLPFGALTDQDGQARFDRLSAGPYRVVAASRGYESATQSNVTGPVQLVLRRLGMLSVRVVGVDGHRAAGATVTLAGASLWPAHSAIADDQGMAVIRGLLAGSFDVRATLGNAITPTVTNVQLARGEHRELKLHLVPGRRVHVLVVDNDAPDALPVAHADVVLATGGISSFPLQGRTGKDGMVWLGPLEPGPATVTVFAKGFVSPGAVAVPEKPDEPFRVALLHGATLNGKVVDSRGNGIDGASLEIVGTDRAGLPIQETPALRAFRAAHFDWSLAGPRPLLPSGELGVMPGPIPAIPGARAASSDYALPLEIAGLPSNVTHPDIELGNYQPWVTRYDGEFSAFPVTPGRVRAIARHPAYVEGMSEVVVLEPGGEAEVTITLRGGGSLEGRVVDAWDRPVPGARVQAMAMKGSLTRATVSAIDGSFAFAALPGEVMVSVERPDSQGSPSIRKRVTIREGERETVTLVLPEPRGQVLVRVVDEADQPIQGVELLVTSLDVAASLRQTCFTDAEGQVTLADARGLELRVRGDASGYVPAELLTPAAPDELRLVLKRGVLVTGRVTSVRGRRYVEAARVTLLSGGVRRSALTDADGQWRIADVPPGPVELTIEAPALAHVQVERTVERTGRLDRPFDVGEIDLPEPAQVSGTVVDSEARPVSGAEVSLSAVSTRTGKDGGFTLEGVAPGKAMVKAQAKGVGSGQSEPLNLEPGGTVTDLRIVLAGKGREPLLGAQAGVAISLVGREGGVFIDSVTPGSDAERSGLLAGDRIESIDGVAVTDVAGARRRLTGSENRDVLIELSRSNKRLKIRTVCEPLGP